MKQTADAVQSFVTVVARMSLLEHDLIIYFINSCFLTRNIIFASTSSGLNRPNLKY